MKSRSAHITCAQRTPVKDYMLSRAQTHAHTHTNCNAHTIVRIWNDVACRIAAYSHSAPFQMQCIDMNRKTQKLLRSRNAATEYGTGRLATHGHRTSESEIDSQAKRERQRTSEYINLSTLIRASACLIYKYILDYDRI